MPAGGRFACTFANKCQNSSARCPPLQSSSRWSGISTWTCPVYNRVPAYADCSSFISWVYWTAYGAWGVRSLTMACRLPEPTCILTCTP